MDNDLIAREAAIAEVEQWAEHGYDVIHWTGIKAMLETQPAVDAVPVVRCKDCWKCGYDNCPMDDYFDIHPMEPDFFCAAGEPEDKRPRIECGPDYCEIGGGDDES